MNSNVTIRHIGPDDLPLLMAVPEGLFDNPVDPEQVAAFLADPLREIVLAFDGDLAVGMASGTVLLYPDKPPSMFINEVGARDSHLRRGIGTAVTEKLFEIARARGCRGIWRRFPAPQGRRHWDALKAAVKTYRDHVDNALS